MRQLKEWIFLKDAIKVKGLWRFTWLDYSEKNNITGFKQSAWFKNVIVSVGKAFLAQLITGRVTNNIPWYMAAGTGTTPATNGDVKLQTEGFRKIVTNKLLSATTMRIRTYLLATDAIGNWSEFGIFLAGTAVANSGTLLSRILPPGGVSKTSNQVLTVETDITIA